MSQTWLKGITCQVVWQEVGVLTFREGGALIIIRMLPTRFATTSPFWELVRGEGTGNIELKDIV